MQFDEAGPSNSVFPREEEDNRSKSTSSERDEDSENPETKKMSMEERKVKFNELRKKMVRVVIIYCISTFIFIVSGRIIKSKPRIPRRRSSEGKGDSTRRRSIRETTQTR